MLTDYDEWREFISQISSNLRNQFYCGDRIVCFSIDQSFDNMIVYDIVSEEIDLVLHKIDWNRRIDTDKLLNPLEKVKLLGKRQPTIQKNKFIFSKNEAKYIQEYHKTLINNNIQKMDEGIILDGCTYHLSLFSNDNSKNIIWQIDSKIPEDISSLIAFIKQY